MGRVRVLAVLTGAALLVASGCSSNDEAAVIAAGDTAEAVVTAALDAAQSGSGRMVVRVDVDEEALERASEAFEEQAEQWAAENGIEGSEESGGWEPFDMGEDDEEELTTTLEFRADDYRVLDEDGTVTAMYIDGRAYESAAARLDWGQGVFGEDDPASEPFVGPQLPDGVEWIEAGEDADRLSISSGVYVDTEDRPHVVRSGDLRDVVDAGRAEVDGTPTHRYTASLTEAALEGVLGLDEIEEALDSGEVEDGFAERIEAMDAYLAEHVSVEVEVHLDDDGRLVRVAVSTSLEVGEHATCLPLLMGSVPMTLMTDYSDLGAELDLAAPPADSTISQDEYVELEDEAFEQWMQSGSGFGIPELPLGPSDRSWGPGGEPIELATADGERYRADIEDDLVKFGSVIGLDPATVGDLDDAALVDAHDRASAAIAALPTTTTALGELTRIEMLWNVRWGMETFGMDPAAADAMGDQELGALIDGFVGDQGVSGDGVWGDGPMSMAEMESEDWFDEELPSDAPDGDAVTEHEIEDELFFGETFENCPA